SRLHVTVDNAPQVALASVDTDALLREDAVTRMDKSKEVRIGIGRAVARRPADGSWYDLPGAGALWVGEVVSPGALDIKLHVTGLRLAPGAELAIYSPAGGAEA